MARATGSRRGMVRRLPGNLLYGLRIASVRGGPGDFSDGLLVSLRRLDRDGPGVLPGGLLVALQRMLLFETGLEACPAARSYRFGEWIETGRGTCPAARPRRFGGWFDSRRARRLAAARSCRFGG